MLMSFALGGVAQEQTDPARNAAMVTIGVAGNVLYVTDAPVGSEVVIMNMLGERVFCDTTKREKEAFDLNLRNGFYIVKVGTLLKRIIVK